MNAHSPTASFDADDWHKRARSGGNPLSRRTRSDLDTSDDEAGAPQPKLVITGYHHCYDVAKQLAANSWYSPVQAGAVAGNGQSAKLEATFNGVRYLVTVESA